MILWPILGIAVLVFIVKDKTQIRINRQNWKWLLLTAFLLVWPVLIDQAKLDCWLSANACSGNVSIAFYIKLTSLLAGGMLASFAFVPKTNNGWKGWIYRTIIAAGIAGLFFIFVIMADFSREFQF